MRQQVRLEHTARSVVGVPREIQPRHVRSRLKAYPAYGKGIARVLGIPETEIRALI